MEFKDLIGKKIVAIKGNIPYNQRRRKHPDIPIEYILFSDRRTYLELEEQDYYSYHDCSPSARELYLIDDPIQWKYLMETLPDSTEKLI